MPSYNYSSFDYRKPGVYVEEALLVGGGDTASATSTALFVGATNTGPTDQVVRCDTWSDYVRNYGGFDVITSTDPAIPYYYTYLPYAVYSYFQNGGRPCYIQRAYSNATTSGTAASLIVPSAGVTLSPKTITARTTATTSGVTTVTITSNNHGFNATDVVAITGFTGADASFNGTYTLVTIATNTFTFTTTGLPSALQAITTPTTPVGNPVANLVTTNKSVTTRAVATSGDVSTVTLVCPNHTFVVGNTLVISGFTGTDAILNGTYAITAIGGTGATTSFSYVVTGLPSSMQTVAAGAGTGTPIASTVSSISMQIQARNIGASNNSTTSGVTGIDGLSVALTYTDTTNNVFSIIVYLDNSEVERFQNLTMTGSLVGTKRADLAINDSYSGSSYIRITNFKSNVTPVTVINTLDNVTAPQIKGVLSGGTDTSIPLAANYPTAAVAAVNKIQGPLIVNLVGYTTDVNDSAKFVAPSPVSSTSFPDRGDIFIVHDGVRPRGYNETSSTYKAAVNSSLSQFSGDSYVAAYTPWIIVPNPTQAGSTITIPPGGAVAGVMSRIDSTIGVFRAPAGLVAGIDTAVGVDSKWTDSELGDINSSNINVIRSVPGAGISIMGARTRKTYGADRYVSARRTLIYLKESLRRSTQFALFENNDQRLWTQLQMTADRILRPLWEAGGLRGNSPSEAYYIKCDSIINTPAIIQSGEVRLEIGVALEYPAEFIVIRVTQFESGGFTAEVQPKG